MESSGTKNTLPERKSYPSMEAEHLGDPGCILSAVWCVNLPCVRDAAVPRGVWPLEKSRREAGLGQNVAGFASSYT